MPRHPRTIWKPIGAAAVDLSFVSTQMQVTSMASVDADASEGLVIKHFEYTLSMGLSHASALTNNDWAAVRVGLFKWPKDAATPSASTIDTANASAIFNRKLLIIQGINPVRYTVRMKSARLRLGQELWLLTEMTIESGAPADALNIAGTGQFWQTQA